MLTTTEYLALVQRERERDSADRRLARIAACLRACCDPTAVARFLRAIGRAPVACRPDEALA